jgi:DNA polymerase V
VSIVEVTLGFPSPAADYVERHISLDKKFIEHPAATYFMRAGQTYWRVGIMNGVLLVVDSSLIPCDGSLLICRLDGALKIKRSRVHPGPHLVNLENGKREEIPDSTGDYSVTSPVFEVITYIINDARSGEFDSCPVI